MEFFEDIYNRIHATFILDDRYLYFLEGLKLTIIMTLASFVFGTLLGFGLVALERGKNKFLAKLAKVVSNFFVQLPTMVMLMIFVYIIFGESALSILIIIIFGLSIKAAAYMAEIFGTALDAVAPGEIEAARTLGMTKVQAFFNITWPQAVKAALPVYKNQFISTMQETSVVGYLAVMDLTRASEIVMSRTLDAFFGLIAISVIYLVLGVIGQALLNLADKTRHITSIE